jgi:hypothetical protein
LFFDAWLSNCATKYASMRRHLIAKVVTVE